MRSNKPPCPHGLPPPCDRPVAAHAAAEQPKTGSHGPGWRSWPMPGSPDRTSFTPGRVNVCRLQKSARAPTACENRKFVLRSPQHQVDGIVEGGGGRRASRAHHRGADREVVVGVVKGHVLRFGGGRQINDSPIRISIGFVNRPMSAKAKAAPCPIRAAIRVPGRGRRAWRSAPAAPARRPSETPG